MRREAERFPIHYIVTQKLLATVYTLTLDRQPIMPLLKKHIKRRQKDVFPKLEQEIQKYQQAILTAKYTPRKRKATLHTSASDLKMCVCGWEQSWHATSADGFGAFQEMTDEITIRMPPGERYLILN